ncbi:MAG: DsbA family protein [Nitrosopumilus sp.]
MLSRFYLLAIPIIIGILTGVFLSFSNEPENNTLLTAKNLIEYGSPVIGSPFAPITIIEWGDYQCTFCYRFHQTSLDHILNEYVETGKVKLVFKDFPLNGPDSVLAAEATYCADDQGKYWEYHDELYNNWGGEKTGWITRDSLERFAISVELDLEKFNACLDSGKYQNHVLSSYKFGQEIGIDATPSFLIFNDEKVMKIRGNQPLEVFLKSFEEL